MRPALTRPAQSSIVPTARCPLRLVRGAADARKLKLRSTGSAACVSVCSNSFLLRELSSLWRLKQVAGDAGLEDVQILLVADVPTRDAFASRFSELLDMRVLLAADLGAITCFRVLYTGARLATRTRTPTHAHGPSILA